MKFRGHETFFIRKGWLGKGMKNVADKADVFVTKEVNPMDILGIGSNMVKSLRYWMQAAGLATEPRSGKRVQTLTDLGRIIYQQDPYLEELGTLLLLQYELATNIELATSWYFFFQELVCQYLIVRSLSDMALPYPVPPYPGFPYLAGSYLAKSYPEMAYADTHRWYTPCP